jgi:hypothetical protein
VYSVIVLIISSDLVLVLNTFHNRIHCMVLPYLKGFLLIILCGFFSIVLWIYCVFSICGDYIGISIQVLNLTKSKGSRTTITSIKTVFPAKVTVFPQPLVVSLSHMTGIARRRVHRDQRLVHMPVPCDPGMIR